MASDITTGRLEPEKTSNGGLKAIFFINGSVSFTPTYNVTNTETIDSVTADTPAFKFDLKGNTNTCSLGDPVSSRDNGTTFFKQTLAITLKKLTNADHQKIKKMAVQSPKVIVQDNNDNYFLLGLKRGLEVTGGTVVTGGAMGDLSGYTLTFEGEEPSIANFLNGTPTAVGFDVTEGV